jgi:hypothetical protein
VEYVYDPAGNIVQVNRTTVAPGVLATFNFTPQRGPVGTAVTIVGQNFATIQGGTNRYSYAFGNPSSFGDPRGTDPFSLTLGGLGGVGLSSAGLTGAGALAAGGQLIGAGALGWIIGRGIGNLPIGNGMTIDDALTGALTQVFISRMDISMPLPPPVCLSKGGRQRIRDSAFEGLSVRDLEKMLDAAKASGDTTLIRRLIKELKARGKRNIRKRR